VTLYVVLIGPVGPMKYEEPRPYPVTAVVVAYGTHCETGRQM